MKFKVLAALAALSVTAGSASAAVFEFGDTLQSGQSRTYTFDVTGASGLIAQTAGRYTWYFPIMYPVPDGHGGYTYPLIDSSPDGYQFDGCVGSTCTPDSPWPINGSYIRIITALSPTQVIVTAENHNVDIPFSNCSGLTEFSICAVTFKPSTVYVSFNYFGDAPTYSVSDTGVPEPATWAMMILGFGLVGATLRRRRLEIA